MPPSVVVVDVPSSAPRRQSEDGALPPRPTLSSSSSSSAAATAAAAARGASADSDNQRSASLTGTSGSERIVYVYPGKPERTSSGGSRSARTSASSSSTRSYPSDGSWSEVDYEEELEDDIDPSDSASRSRRHLSRRHTVEVRAAPSRTRPLAPRRASEREDEARSHRLPPRRHHSGRQESQSRPRRSSSRRIPSDESSGTVASTDDYPHYGRRGPPRAAYPPDRYRQPPPQSHGAYPPSMTSGSAYHDLHASQAIMRTQHQDAFGYPQPPNPFAPQGQPPNPFSPISAAEGSSYFATEPMAPLSRHHRPDGPTRPQSYVAPPSHYGTDMVSLYPPYPQYPIPAYPPYPMAGWPPSRGSSPVAKDDRAAELESIRQLIVGKKAEELAREERAAEFDALKQAIARRDTDDSSKKKEDKVSEIAGLKELLKKHEEESIARQKAWIAEREADAAARAAEKAKAEEDKKRKQEIDDARKKAKEDAEKKAEEAAKKTKEEADKKLAEAEKAKEEADKAKKALEEEIKKNKPEPDTLKAPIKFKDAVGRKFSFPWHLCKTWKGMEGLIKQAFLHVDVIGDHVRQGHYDLTGPDGEIILPQVWDTMVKPDTEITMHLWPMEEEKKDDPFIDSFAGMGMGPMPGWDMPMDPGHGGKSKKGKKDGKKKKSSPEAVFVHPNMPPPPPQHGIPPAPGGGGFADPFMGFGGAMPGFPPMPGEVKRDSKGKARSKSKTSKEISPLAAWFAGGSVSSKPARKK